MVSTQGDAVNPDASQPSEVVEFTHDGQFVSEFSVDSVWSICFRNGRRQRFDGGFIFAAVDDDTVVLDV